MNLGKGYVGTLLSLQLSYKSKIFPNKRFIKILRNR